MSPRPPPPALACGGTLSRRAGWGRRGSRAAAGGADLPHRAALAVLRAGRLVRLAFRPGPAASTLDSARRVKSGRAVAGRQAGPADGRPGAERAGSPARAGSRACRPSLARPPGREQRTAGTTGGGQHDGSTSLPVIPADGRSRTMTWRMRRWTCWPWPGSRSRPAVPGCGSPPPRPAGRRAHRLVPAAAPPGGRRRGRAGAIVRASRRRARRDGGGGVQVWAVAAGSLVRVAGWDLVSLDLWPEMRPQPGRLRAGRAARTAGPRCRCRLPGPGRPDRGGRSVPTAFPALPARVNPAG